MIKVVLSVCRRKSLRCFGTAIDACLVTALIALLSFWIASYSHPPAFHVGFSGRYAVVCSPGIIQFRRLRCFDVLWDRSNRPSIVEVAAGPLPSGLPVPHVDLLRTPIRIAPQIFQHASLHAGGVVPDVRGGNTVYLPFGNHVDAWTAPCWAFAAALGLLVIWRLHRRFNHKPPTPGTCPACGYDLRATPQQCPECGTPSLTLLVPRHLSFA